MGVDTLKLSINSGIIERALISALVTDRKCAPLAQVNSIERVTPSDVFSSANPIRTFLLVFLEICVQYL